MGFNSGFKGLNHYTILEEETILDVHESVHRDTTVKITNKMHYID